MSDDRDDERPGGEPRDPSGDLPAEPAADGSEGPEAVESQGSSAPPEPPLRKGPAMIDMEDLEAMDDPGDGIEVEGLEERAAAPELGIDLTEFDAEIEGTSALGNELGAARSLVDELRREKGEVEAEVAALRDQLLRGAADLENYRKRIERDRREEKKQATAGLVLKLLPVADNFQRALGQGEVSAAGNDAVGAFIDGVRLIETQFFDILRAAGLETVKAEGSFDPALHEALMQEPSRAPHLSILEVYERGYLFGGRLLRPARVKVASNPSGVDAASDDDGAGATPDEPAETGGSAEVDDRDEAAADVSAAGDGKQDSE